MVRPYIFISSVIFIIFLSFVRIAPVFAAPCETSNVSECNAEGSGCFWFQGTVSENPHCAQLYSAGRGDRCPNDSITRAFCYSDQSCESQGGNPYCKPIVISSIPDNDNPTRATTIQGKVTLVGAYDRIRSMQVDFASGQNGHLVRWLETFETGGISSPGYSITVSNTYPEEVSRSVDYRISLYDASDKFVTSGYGNATIKFGGSNAFNTSIEVPALSVTECPSGSTDVGCQVNGYPPVPVTVSSDVAVTKIEMDTKPGPNEAVDVKVTIKNNGPDALKSSSAKIYAFRHVAATQATTDLTPNNSSASVDIGDLSSEQEKTVTVKVNVPLVVGSYNLVAVADAGKVLTDNTRDNNKANLGYTVEAAAQTTNTCTTTDVGRGQTTCKSGYSCELVTNAPQCVSNDEICAGHNGRVRVLTARCDGTKWLDTWMCGDGSTDPTYNPTKDSQCAATPTGTAITCYTDGDEDTYGDKDAAGTTVNALVCPTGKVLNNKDCHDGNDKVNPEHIQYETAPYSAKGGGNSFDYDCDGEEEKAFKVSTFTGETKACQATKPSGVVGFDQDTACGQTGAFKICWAYATTATCEKDKPTNYLSNALAVSDSHNQSCPAGAAGSAWVVRKVQDYVDQNGKPAGALTTQLCR